MHTAPPFPPAERLGIALMGLIHALAARAGWWIPKWVIALMEDQVRGLVEALSLLAAEVAAGRMAPLPDAAPATDATEAAEARCKAPASGGRGVPRAGRQRRPASRQTGPAAYPRQRHPDRPRRHRCRHSRQIASFTRRPRHLPAASPAMARACGPPFPPRRSGRLGTSIVLRYQNIHGPPSAPRPGGRAAGPRRRRRIEAAALTHA